MHLTDASRFLISCVIQHYAPVVGWGVVEEQLHNVDNNPGPQLETNIKIASAGDQPGSPASQADTLPKELSRQLTVYQRCGSGMFFLDPGS
jgi:hypothetical protein